MGYDIDAATDLGNYAVPDLASVSRYTPPPGQQWDWKRVQLPEAQKIRDAGKVLRCNVETSATMAEGGPAQADVAVAAAEKALTDFPWADSTVWFSNDTADTYDAVAPFYAEVANRMGPQGYYGQLSVGVRLRQGGLVSKLWISGSWGFDGFASWAAMRAAAVAAGAHLIQHLDKPVSAWPANAYDYNEILRPDYIGDNVLDPNNPVDKGVIDGVGLIVNALVNPGNAPHSLLQDIIALETQDKAALTSLNGAVASLKLSTGADPAAIAAALLPLLAPADAKAVGDELARRLVS